MRHAPNLVVSGTALGELEDNGTAGQSAVDLAVGIESVVNTTALLLVENNLDGLAAVLLGADALANDLDGVDEVGEDGVVDSGQSAGTGTLLGLVGARVDGALGAGEDAALSDEEDVAVGELLLELTGEAVNAFLSVFLSFLLQFHFACAVGVSYRCWILWKPWRRGTGTKMRIAFLPWPTSTCNQVSQTLSACHAQCSNPIHLFDSIWTAIDHPSTTQARMLLSQKFPNPNSTSPANAQNIPIPT